MDAEFAKKIDEYYSKEYTDSQVDLEAICSESSDRKVRVVDDVLFTLGVKLR